VNSKLLISLLLIGIVLLSGCTNNISKSVSNVVSKPSLSVYGLNSESKFGFSEGCYGIVRGSVRNSGNADAKGTYVECKILNSNGGVIASGSQNLGTIYANGERSFSIKLDVSCFGEKPAGGDCKVYCSNC